MRRLPILLSCLVLVGIASPVRADEPKMANAADASKASPAASGPERFSHLESVQTFDQVMRTLGELRHVVLSDARTDREASEGMRFILRTLTMSQDVTGDGYPKAPHFARMDSKRRKIGGDNPDAEYDNMAWDGRFDYRIDGQVGSVDHLSFTVLAMQPNGRSKSIGYLNERDLELDENGNFTIWMTAEDPKKPGNWVKTGPAAGAGNVLVRQYIGDRSQEELATYEVKVVGRERLDPLPPSTDAEVARAMKNAIGALNGIGLLHRYVSPSLGEEPNSFRLRNSDDFGADISSSDNLYVIGTYDFKADEALIIEVDLLDVRYWNFAIENPWHESVDYMQRKTSRTHDDVQADPDGKVRFVLAHGRTDHPNYLETGGHERGFMTFRWVGERETKAPLPKVTRVPLAQAVARAQSISKAATR
jgi:hypothetical protein